MGNGLYLGDKGLSLGTGLYQDAEGLWSGAAGFQAGGGTAAPVPLTVIDFKNGIYTIGGVSKTLGDMFRTLNNGYWDPSYAIDPADIEAGVGWHATTSGTTTYALLSLAAMVGWWQPGTIQQFSAVIDGNGTPGAGGSYFYFNPAEATTTDPQCGFLLGRGASPFSYNYVTNGDASKQYSTGNVDPAATGDFKIGMTVNAATDYLAAVVNGGTVSSGTATTLNNTGGAFTPDYSTMDAPYIYNAITAGGSGLIRSINIYAPLSDSVLQGLTA